MWNCENCGCQAIAGSLGFCPACFKERDMPKNTVEGGYTNQALGTPEDAPGVQGTEPGEDLGEDTPEEKAAEVEGDYSTYTVRDLVEACKERGLSYSGPNGTLAKDELVARLNEQPQE